VVERVPVPSLLYQRRQHLISLTAIPKSSATSASTRRTRIHEYSPDVQFTEKHRWTAGQFDVSIEQAADESVVDYRIGFIAPCVCGEIPRDQQSSTAGDGIILHDLGESWGGPRGSAILPTLSIIVAHRHTSP